MLDKNFQLFVFQTKICSFVFRGLQYKPPLFLSAEQLSIFFQKVDMAAQALSSLHTRAQVMDYVFPFYADMTVGMYRKPASQTQVKVNGFELTWLQNLSLLFRFWVLT